MKSKTCLEYLESFQLVPHFVATGYVVVVSLLNTQISLLGSDSLFFSFYTYLDIKYKNRRFLIKPIICLDNSGFGNQFSTSAGSTLVATGYVVASLHNPDISF